MNTMVAARVPTEIKEQGDGILKSLGSNPTELINRAYSYLLKYGALPGDAAVPEPQKDQHRLATADMLDQLRADYAGMSLPVEDAWGSKDFKEIRDELGDERYARFA